jgi:hypothetical protein
VTSCGRSSCAVDELADRILTDQAAPTGVRTVLPIGERSQSLTEIYVDGGAGLRHVRAGVRR